MNPRAAVAAIMIAVAAAAPASAAPALLVDAGTGVVLHATEATRSWRPASLTKLMTVHLALSAVESGRLSMATPVRISAAAASQPPSRLGLPAGRHITLGEAVKVLLVKSANDVAVAVAETVGGNEAAFVASMNAEAARLGMSGTHFANPHGLDDPMQVTTARDVAVLALVVQRVHAGYAPLFAMPTVSVAGKTLKNTNNLLGKYPGIDGMKTGYVCASGFNIAASATVGGRRLLAVVLGAPSAAVRGERVRKLLDAGFGNRLAPTGALASLKRRFPVTAADLRPANCGRDGEDAAEDPAPNALVAAAGLPSDLPPDLAAALLAIGGSAPEPGTPYGLPPAAMAAVPVPVPAPRVGAPAAVDALFLATADAPLPEPKPVAAAPSVPLPVAAPEPAVSALTEVPAVPAPVPVERPVRTAKRF